MIFNFRDTKDAKTLGGHEAEYFFPKSGGTIDGAINQSKTDTTAISRYLQNSTRKIQEFINSTGSYGLSDVTNGKNIIVSTADGTNTFNGTASGNLPLTGGTLKRADFVLLTLESTLAGDRPTIKFVGTSGTLGYLGFEETQNPCYFTASGASRTLLHTGNMASHVLPLSGGGTVQKNGAIPIALQNTEGSTTLIQFYGKDGNLGYLGISTANTPIFRTTDGTYKDLLHTGNSAKTVISNTAPSDTTALWIDTSA